MGKINNPINLLRDQIAARDAEIEKLAPRVTQLEELTEMQAALIVANGEHERLLLECIANALASLDREATGSARLHLLAANAHPRLEELARQIESAQAVIARALAVAVEEGDYEPA